MTWIAFKEFFLAQYFYQIVQDGKRKEFINLIQGTSIVTEYEAQFTSLSRFGKELISTGHHKC